VQHRTFHRCIFLVWQFRAVLGGFARSLPEGSHGALSGFVNLGGQIGGFCAPIAVGAFVGATHSYADGFALMAGACAVLCAQGARSDSVTHAIANVQ
jgi:nitrate/nitrite transporter NarK